MNLRYRIAVFSIGRNVVNRNNVILYVDLDVLQVVSLRKDNFRNMTSWRVHTPQKQTCKFAFNGNLLKYHASTELVAL